MGHRRNQPAAGGGGRPPRRAAALARLHGVSDDLRPRHRARAALREPPDQVSTRWQHETGLGPLGLLVGAPERRTVASVSISVLTLFSLCIGSFCLRTCAA